MKTSKCLMGVLLSSVLIFSSVFAANALSKDGLVNKDGFDVKGVVTPVTVGVTDSDFYDLRAAINGYQRRGSSFIRLKGGAGGGTGAEGVDGAGADGSWPPNASSVGSPGGKGSAGSG